MSVGSVGGGNESFPFGWNCTERYWVRFVRLAEFKFFLLWLCPLDVEMDLLSLVGTEEV